MAPAPRHLDTDAIAPFADSLKRYAGTKWLLGWKAQDDEAQEFGDDIDAVLGVAGWSLVGRTQLMIAGPIHRGLTIWWPTNIDDAGPTALIDALRASGHTVTRIDESWQGLGKFVEVWVRGTDR